MIDIVMPRLSDSMEAGTILSWLKASGASVEVGDELLEIETDKSTVTHAAESAGLLQILVPEGMTVAVGEPIARLGAATEAMVPAPLAARIPGAINGNRSDQEPAAGSVRRSAPTPLARRVAAVHGIALDEIDGTGPLGRITRDDVLKRAGVASRDTAAPALHLPPAPVRPPAAPRSDPGPEVDAVGVTYREPSRLQHVIARRMTAAKATVPHFQVQTEVAMDLALALRTDLTSLAGDNDPVPSLNDIIIKAVALALRDHPLANGSFTERGFELHDAVNVGMAVASDDALIVPTILAADTKSLGQIARETRRLAGRVRTGEITPSELSGGTFTVSNLGMFGMTAITPVINPPQAGILGVGAIRNTLTRVQGEIVDSAVMTLTLSCDHRILYGADASRFLADVRTLLETPLKMAL